MKKAKHMTTATAAKSWQLTKATIAKHCRDNKIPGAFKYGGQWYIPSDALKPLQPKDERYFLRLILELKNRPDYKLDFEYEGINTALIPPVCDWLLQRGLINPFERTAAPGSLLYQVSLTKKGMHALLTAKAENKLDIVKIVNAVANIIPIIADVVNMVRG